MRVETRVRRQLMAVMAEAGFSAKEIARRMGCGAPTVYGHVGRGVFSFTRGRKRTAARAANAAVRRSLMVALATAGASLSEVGLRLGVSRQRVQQVVGAGATSRGPGREPDAMRRVANEAFLEKIIALYRAGLSSPQAMSLLSAVGMQPALPALGRRSMSHEFRTHAAGAWWLDARDAILTHAVLDGANYSDLASICPSIKSNPGAAITRIRRLRGWPLPAVSSRGRPVIYPESL